MVDRYFANDRRRRVAILVSQGFTNAAIGQRVGMSEEATKQLIKRMREKIGARNRVVLATYVREHILEGEGE